MFTLIFPHLLRSEHEQLPELNIPTFNHLLRHAQFQAAPKSTAELYQIHLCDQLAQPQNCAYASPINQQMGMNSVTIQHGAALAITAAEAQTLCDGLNQLYGADAHFHPIRPDLWQIQFLQNIDWQVENIFNLNQLLDPNEAAADWLQLATETQMYLHAHPINQDRKSCPINGLWIWNAPSHAPAFQPAAKIASDSAWISHSSQDCAAMPTDFQTWQRDCVEQNIDLSATKIFSETFVHAADAYSYAEQWANWERNFFAPIAAALQSGSLKQVKIVCEQGELCFQKPKAWAFWKPEKVFDGKRF